MNKTFRLNVDVQLDNGTVVTVDQIALGKDVTEAYRNGSQTLLAWPDSHITRVMDLNFSEQIDPNGYLEREYQGSHPYSREGASTRGSSGDEYSFQSRMRVAPAAIFLNDELLAFRAETYVMVSSLVKRLGHFLNKEAFVHGFANVPIWGTESDPSAIMMILQKDCFDYLKRHPSEQFAVYDGTKHQLHTISLNATNHEEESLTARDIQEVEPTASKESASDPALLVKKVSFLRDLLLEDLKHLVVTIEAKGLDIDLEDPRKWTKTPHEGRVLMDMIYAYSSFVQEVEGTPYFDAWIDHLRSQESAS